MAPCGIAIGALVPSGRRLARAMAAEVAGLPPGPLVELGGGTGSITAALLKSAVAPGDLYVVEREPEFAAVLDARFPDVRVIEGDARQLRALLRPGGVTAARAVVSSLPLLSFPDQLCREIVAEAFALLAPEGRFVQFTYGFLAPLSPALADELGLRASRGTWVLENVPPAFVWTYRRRADAA